MPATPTFRFLLVALLAGQTLGTMATSMLPAVAPKVAETYGVYSSLIGYQSSLLALGSIVAVLPHVSLVFASAIALGLGYGLITPSVAVAHHARQPYDWQSRVRAR